MNIEQLLRQIQETPESANVRMVFGEPTTVGDTTVIPVARVRGAQGMGFGEGKQESDNEKEASGRGGGSGGVFSARPVSVIEISPRGVRVVPIVDVTRVAMAGLLVFAWNFFWITRLVRAVRLKSDA